MRNKLTVNANYINQRLDNYLTRELKKVPKSLIYRLIRKGAIKVNNKRTKPDYKLLLNDEISLPQIDRPELNSHQKNSDNKYPGSHNINNSLVNLIKDNIILENKDFIALNKPSGIAVHGGSNIKLGIIDILRKIYGPKFYLELVHRLDRETSGVLLIAKNRIALTDLHDKIKAGEIEKNYLALVKGAWPNSKRLITHPIRKSVLQGGERMVMVDPENGKASTTRVEVKAAKKGTSLLQLTAVTGRTHQLRVHCAYESFPIIGDTKYGNKAFNKEVKEKTNLKRTFLHAHNLTFSWGSAKNKLSITADIPKDLQETLSYYGYI